MASGGGGGGESQPHLRVTAQSINNSVRSGTGAASQCLMFDHLLFVFRRIHQDLHHTVARTMDDLFDRSPGAASNPLAPTSSPLAAHLGLTSPPGLGQSPPPGLQTASSVVTSPSTWQDNITVTVQPQLNIQPQSPSHVLDIEVRHSKENEKVGETGLALN